MDQLALEAGTDKSSAFHNYTRIYSKYFDPIRNEPLKFLEIGIYRGNSVKMWEKYFPNAELHFIDIDFKQIKYHSTRSHYHFVNQNDLSGQEALAQSLGGNFDIIIDDGGHRMNEQITSFKALFPHVKSGGMYIIEDLHTSYWKSHGGYGNTNNPKSGPDTCVTCLQNLVDDVNYYAAVNRCADPDKISPELRNSLNYHQEHIEAIFFYNSICIILKR
ncbi:MAG: class I SAM-dependent methyltransferase [Chlamydiia bacterium]|nr:class I SAM-dependent methyltransferase [Chlamydiia bacterium]